MTSFHLGAPVIAISLAYKKTLTTKEIPRVLGAVSQVCGGCWEEAKYMVHNPRRLTWLTTPTEAGTPAPSGEGAAAAAGGGSWIQMENEGEAGASAPKAQRPREEHVIPGGWWLFPSCSQAPSTPGKPSTWP